MLSAEELLAGSALAYEVAIPEELVAPSEPAGEGARNVRLRPLTVRDLQLVMRAAKENDTLVAALMVQRSLLEPELSVAQSASMPAGVLSFLLQQVNRISGITASDAELQDSIQAPLTRAAFVLSQEFGWTPQQVSELTLGQLLVHLKLLQENRAHAS